MKNCQDVATMIGKYGCLALCYIRLFQVKCGSKTELSPLSLLVSCYDELIKNGSITESMFVQDPAKLIYTIFGRKVEIIKSDKNTTGEWQIMNNGQHFVIGNDASEIVWNSMNNDAAWCKLGLKDWRIMTIKE